MSRILQILLVSLAAAFALSRPAYAQSTSGTASPPSAAETSDDPAANARIHAGPLGLTPTFALRDVGVTSNVYNSPDNPQQDFTAAFGPGVLAWLTTGVVRVSTATSTGWNYFQKNTKQRSFDFSESDRVDLRLLHVVPHVGASYNRTRQRPNLEIDERVLQKLTSLDGGASLVLGTRLSFDVDYKRSRVDFNQGEFGDPGLAAALNRRSVETDVSARVALTPLTTFTTAVVASRDRFDFSPLRNSNSLSIAPGIEFKPLALLSGSASLGFRRFNALAGGVTDYAGLIGAVSLRFTASDQLRVVTTFNRDIDYSFDDVTPYYVATTGGVEVTQAIGGAWDLQGRFQVGSLAYRGDVLAQALGTSRRTDHYRAVGAGPGRHLTDNVRIGLNVDYATRTSTLDEHSYSGYRIGGSLTYGF